MERHGEKLVDLTIWMLHLMSQKL